MRIFQDTKKTYRSIPLGVTGNGQTIFMMLPEIKGQQISNTFIIVGQTNSGKTFIKKNIAFIIAAKRPVYLFDWAGRDDYLCYYPNTDGLFLAPGVPKKGLPGYYFYYPTVSARKKHKHEKIVRPNFSKYNLQQYVSLGFSEGAAYYIQNAIKRYGPFKDFETFVDFIINFPASEYESNKMYEKQDQYTLKHDKFYEPGDKIPTASKDNLTRVLPYLLRMEIFRMDNKEEIDYRKHFKRADNLIFSYNDKTKYYPKPDIALAKCEINYATNELESYREDYPDGKRPFLFVEEAHRVYGGSSTSPMARVIESFVLECRKLSVGLCLTLPDVTELDTKVLTDLKDLIIGNYKGKGLQALKTVIGGDRGNVIPFLKLNRWEGEREFVYYNQDFDNFFRIVKTYEPPCGVHREIKIKQVVEV